MLRSIARGVASDLIEGKRGGSLMGTFFRSWGPWGISGAAGGLMCGSVDVGVSDWVGTSISRSSFSRTNPFVGPRFIGIREKVHSSPCLRQFSHIWVTLDSATRYTASQRTFFRRQTSHARRILVRFFGRALCPPSSSIGATARRTQGSVWGSSRTVNLSEVDG